MNEYSDDQSSDDGMVTVNTGEENSPAVKVMTLEQEEKHLAAVIETEVGHVLSELALCRQALEEYENVSSECSEQVRESAELPNCLDELEALACGIWDCSQKLSVCTDRLRLVEHRAQIATLQRKIEERTIEL